MKDEKQEATTTKIQKNPPPILTGLLGLGVVLLITACVVMINDYNTPLKVVNETPIETIEFTHGTGIVNYGKAVIETEKLIETVYVKDVKFIEVDNDKPFSLVEYEPNNNNDNTYDIHIPTNQLKDISRAYTDSYTETLPVTMLESKNE